MSHRLLLVAGLALLVAACGSDSAPEAPAPETSAAEQAPSADSSAGASAQEAGARAPRVPVAVPEGYEKGIRAWQDERDASLRREEGWLSLVGLYWLEQEENTVGGVPGNDLVFPKAPERVCTLRLDRGPEGPIVTVEPEPGVDLALAPPDEAEDEGAAPELVTEPRRMVPDTQEGTTRLALGPLRFWLIERGDRVGVRVLDRQSPALEAFEGLEFFPVDPALRLEARLVPKEGLTVSVPNVLGQISEQPCPGEVVFRVPEAAGGDGKEVRLLPMDAGDQLFFVFGDRTNGRTTYGGGRFLYAEKPDPGDPDGRLILDFNRAYNPPCAFTEYATCPLPPRANKLAVAIEVGEKAYAGGPAHH